MCKLNKKRIGIVFGSKPHLNTNAFKFFILSINNLQSYFEFCFPIMAYEPLVYPFSSRVCPFDKMDESFKIEKYSKAKMDHWIVIISSRFDNNYFIKLGKNISYITTNAWKRRYSPPSLFEYLLHSIILSILNSNTEVLQSGHHYETIGCIADFTKNKKERRVSIALGYICDYHKSVIISENGEKYYNEIISILSKHWIGVDEDKNSVAFLLKYNFKFDLLKDSGFKKNKMELLKDQVISLSNKISNETIRIIIAALLGYFMARFRLKI